jgi:hypothetical protein
MYTGISQQRDKEIRALVRPWRRLCAGETCASSTLLERERERARATKGLPEGSANIKFCYFCRAQINLRLSG